LSKFYNFRLKFVIVILCFKFSAINAQQKYWIFFEEREITSLPNVSSKTISNRKMLGLGQIQATDYGPKKEFLNTLNSLDINILNTSKWFNGVSAYLTDTQVKQLNLVKGISSIREITSYQTLASKTKPTDYYLHFALKQIHSEAFIDRDINGKGVDIGVIDGGYYQAHNDGQLANLFKNQKIIKYKDFINPSKKDFFGTKDSNADWHGTAVLKAIGGKDSSSKLVIGLANQSTYYLARTESSAKESRVEEDCWLAAIEWLDSSGVRLVNSSLGYAQGFTNPAENYSPNDMDGQTSLIAKAAKMAVNEKGMIVVVSAGNEGENKKWGGIVSTPADVNEVISVGANDKYGFKMPYSSIGSDKVKFLKPDLTVYSEDGTSLAAPIVTGFVACMLQIDSSLTADYIKFCLRANAKMGVHPNNFVGYGYPNTVHIVDRLIDGVIPPKQFIEDFFPENYTKIKTYSLEKVIVIHKKESVFVVSQVEILPINGYLEITRPANVNASTVFLREGIKEITWKIK
jgi:subtilisin family serine protease